MPIQAIDLKAMRSQVDPGKTKPLNGIGFTDYLGAASGPAAEAMALKAGYTPAAVTQAAITGVAGAPASFGGAASTPYYSPTLGTAATPFGSGGYGYGGATYAPGYTGTGAGIGGGVSGNYGSVGASYTAPGGVSGAPSQDYQEKQALFQQMNDANWEMLVAQVTVNDLSRDYQARSNILKTKADAEANSVRNMKA